MDANFLVGKLKKEASCPICLEYFQNPVFIHCGHSFCQACITECWEDLEKNISCPQCGESSLLRTSTENQHLARIVEIAKCLNLEATKTVTEEPVCERHLELQKVFCKNDKIPICLVCQISKEHRDHSVIPMEEAAQDYKEQLQRELQVWKQKREELQALKLAEEKRHKQCLERLGNEGTRIVSEFEQLRQFLEAPEQLLLARLEQLQKEVIKEEKIIVSRLSEEISNLSDLITEIEEKHKQPTSEFLQNLKHILNRCESQKIQKPVDYSSDLEKRLNTFSEKNKHLEDTLKTLKGVLCCAVLLLEQEGTPVLSPEQEGTPSSKDEMEVRKSRRLFQLPCTELKKIGNRVNVTLDPETANPFLILSADQKSVRLGDLWQDVPDTPERFDPYPCVLGCQAFMSGRHYWEVEVGNGSYWAVGFAKESVRRKGEIIPCPEEQIWALQQYGDRYEALTNPVTILSLSSYPKRVRIFLDYEENQVAFFDANTEALIYLFSPVTFCQEKILPWLWVWPGTELRLYQ